ncbi:tail fiber protein [Pseudomonas sp. 10B1]|uniref:phage tail protein n=1 Tax=unclassified Pseudomonas TaxID=196821 RepID=UPI002AB4A153|nr:MULTISPECIES: tail fiber protein [unclassified Pseudomonas]MDY7562739.1 tail fiber protein [Pseudomonas sp. AB6]MEA9977397.1 tail fiber protein [Pseudomonas sp. RTS4]MEA9996930.1 tail fiber protein [Pseudomonas sp. AA4]MEB0089149.1 tail fiber protein [Pseudomonas sp. RTI1]MEB0128341.1 tail fiber protein [Pseudomonas sp. CCC1.2]
MDVFIGNIQMFGFNFAPRGWALCDGSLLQVQQFQALFTLLGTTYGGNGSVNFSLPDLRSRLPIGQGAGPNLTPRTVGDHSGTESVVATLDNLPTHSHGTTALHAVTAVKLANAPSNPATVPTATNSYLGASISGGPTSAAIYSDQQGNAPVTLSGVTTGITGITDPAGKGLPMATMNPFLAVNFSIALEGLFPTRN